ncbi:hypothetical protein cand_008660 [Cryptosporidium andersoni]|uniref:Uncharacterized protein n=1 Tax=Cryptosporidium andersoni TaxID=117008 RepID=A0A1J4MPK0_9CRYT|nr:hypothetical protein cand_008660 [Cryptosporidium andersoni]
MAQRISKNRQDASQEYRHYLDKLRTNKTEFWKLCRSVSPPSCILEDIKKKNMIKQRRSYSYSPLKVKKEISIPYKNKVTINNQNRVEKENKDNIKEIKNLNDEKLEPDLIATELQLDILYERYYGRLCHICKTLDLNDIYSENNSISNNSLDTHKIKEISPHGRKGRFMTSFKQCIEKNLGKDLLFMESASQWSKCLREDKEKSISTKTRTLTNTTKNRKDIINKFELITSRKNFSIACSKDKPGNQQSIITNAFLTNKDIIQNPLNSLFNL